MHDLIEHLLKAHRESTATGSVVNLSLLLDQEALAIYAQAEAETTRRLRKKNSDSANRERILRENLAVQLTLALSQSDLCDLVSFALLNRAIERWCPWQLTGQKICLQVRHELLTLLPAARQKQQLEKICYPYRDHLKIEMEKCMQKEPSGSLMPATPDQTLLFGAPDVGDHRRVKRVPDPRILIDQLATGPGSCPLNPGSRLYAVVNKYRVVSELRATLKTPLKSATAQVRDFRRVFDRERSIIENDRDGLGIKFLKAVATVLSIGLAYVCGIWEVKGKKVAENMQNLIQPIHCPSLPKTKDPGRQRT